MHVLATAGHVDHGKSTLVRALTGMEPDRWAEERRRGMTIDLGFAWTTLPGGERLAFVDVPGHERFVTTMLAGVGPVPAVVLVVAADEGWMPQSAEHVDALHALGVRHGLLVVTRSDLMAPELARDEAEQHLAPTSLGELPAVCVSATTGAGMDELRAALAELGAALPAADAGADVRLWVDRAFTIRGSGTVVTGTLAAGTIRVGDELQLARDGQRVRVRGLQSLGEPAEEVTAVARIAVNLRGVPREAVARGDALLTPGRWLTTALVDARLHAPPTPGTPGTNGTLVEPYRTRVPFVQPLPRELTLHIGAAAVPAQVRPLGGDAVRLRLAVPQPLRIGDRALLRDPGRRQITAGLTVLDVQPPALRRRGAAAARAGVLATMDGVPDAAAELARRGLARVADLTAMGADPARSALPQVTAGWLLDPTVAATMAAQLVAAVAEHDAADPLDPGLTVLAARRRLDLPDARLLAALLREPAAAGLVQHDGRIRLAKEAGADDDLPAALQTALEGLRADLQDAPFAAPDTGRLAELGVGPKQLASLVRAGQLDRIGDGVYLLPGATDRATEVLAQLGAEFTLSQARQALGTTRRVAVPLLELLSRTGHTRRTAEGNHRLRASDQM